MGWERKKERERKESEREIQVLPNPGIAPYTGGFTIYDFFSITISLYSNITDK